MQAVLWGKRYTGLIYADVELINSLDTKLARRHIIGAKDIRQISLQIVVDTGSYRLAINENIQAILQLPVMEKRNALTADGRVIECDVAAPLCCPATASRCWAPYQWKTWTY